MFDSNEMRELAALKAYRYARDGGGGSAFKVYPTSKGYHDARTKGMSAFQRAAHEAIVVFRMQADNAKSDFAWACRSHALDAERGADGLVPF